MLKNLYYANKREMIQQKIPIILLLTNLYIFIYVYATHTYIHTYMYFVHYYYYVKAYEFTCRQSAGS